MEVPITPQIQEETSKLFEITSKDEQYELKLNNNLYEDKIILNISPKKDNFLKYEEKYTLNDLININEIFKNFSSLNNLINSFGMLVENKKIFIEKNENDISIINLVFLLYNIIGEESKAILKLKLNKISENDYTKLLLKISNLEKKLIEKDEEIKHNNIECNEKINRLEKRIEEIEKIIKIKECFSPNIKSDILNNISYFKLIYDRLNPSNK